MCNCCPSQPLSSYTWKRLLPLILIIVIIFQSVTGIIGYVILALVFILWVICCLIHYQYCANQAEDVSHSNTMSSSLALANTSSHVDGGGCTGQATRSQRILYLDNIKTFLTIVVVLHHNAIQFGGQPGNWVIQIGLYHNSIQPFITAFTIINQSYFMCLFFFIGAYFVPSSVDKRGPVVFLRERFKRLGIPFLIMILIFWPLLTFAVYCFIGSVNDFEYFPSPGPLWFAGWLLIFSFTYTLCGGPMVVQHFPSLGTLLVVALALGFVQFVLMIALPLGFAFMPITFGSLPFDICFFMAGICCRRSRWLDSPDAEVRCNGDLTRTESEPSQGSLLRFIESHRTFLYVVTVAIAALYCVLVVSLHITEFATPFLQTNSGDDDGQDDDEEENPSPAGPLPRTVGLLFVFCLTSGIFTFTMSLCLLDVFRKYYSFTSKWTAYMADTAYAVYIIHPWIICPLLFGWIKIIKEMSGEDIYFINGGVVSYTDVGSDGYLWAGFVVVGITGVPLCWIMGGMLKKLPGFKSIL